MDLGALREHMIEMSIAGDTAPLWALGLVLLVNLVLTMVHSIEELRGPLWRYFGAIAGIRIPHWLGFPVFTVLLTLILWAAGFAGIAGQMPLFGAVPEEWAMAALGGLIGGRIADGLFSHVRLHLAGFRPNPGLSSTPFYFAEALILAALFFPGLSKHPGWAAAGLVVGALFFWSVLPVLRLISRLIAGRKPAPHPQPWTSGQPIPEWAR